MKEKPISNFQVFWRGGVGTETMPRAHIAIDAWNAAITRAMERLELYGPAGSAELIEMLKEDD